METIKQSLKPSLILKFFIALSIILLSIGPSFNTVNAQTQEATDIKKVLTKGESKKYIKAVEKNAVYNELSGSKKLDKETVVEEYKMETDFDNNVIILQSKVNDKTEHTGILALIDAKTNEVFSITTIKERENASTIVLTEYDANTGEKLLQNVVVEGELVESTSDFNEGFQPYAIKKGSYWWKVICNLAMGGSCSVGCLALIAVPGGYIGCTLLCSSLTGATAC